MKTKTRTANLSRVVDKLGAVKAQIADLKIKAGDLHDLLTESGVDEVEGKLFRATVSVSERVDIDYSAVVNDLVGYFRDGDHATCIPCDRIMHHLRRLVRKHTTAKEVTTVKVVSR